MNKVNKISPETEGTGEDLKPY